jgi:enamine deaminase RidA (YjgF/YER057c/UK114 family)
MSTTNRRKFLKGGAVVAAATTAAAVPAAAQQKPVRKALRADGKENVVPAGGKPPRFSAMVSYGNLLFVSGIGYHKEGDVKVHTKAVLEEIKTKLEAAGSSMEKVLKCNVYLNDLKDYDAMNSVYDGAFGNNPPVRTTIAAAGGIPGNSLVEIDVIAFI